MPDRQWSDGLHQMIEAKENCALSERRETFARITYQRFFRRYRRLAGMSGTLQPVAAEIVVASTASPSPRSRPPSPFAARPSPRRDCARPTAEKWDGIVERVSALHARARRC